MHKFFMTAQEVSIIRGADAIVEELGGFPSMENGRLVSISVESVDERSSLCNITLVFDIWKWAVDTSRYIEIPKPKHRYIRMRFSSLRDYEIRQPSMRNCGEFKFGNTVDRKKMLQDPGTGLNPPIVERPFCSFYMRSGHEGLVLEFDEVRCKISAEFLDDSMRSVFCEPKAERFIL